MGHGEASCPETKREANSIKHHRRKDEPVRASGREGHEGEGGQVGAWPWLGSVASTQGEEVCSVHLQTGPLPGFNAKPPSGTNPYAACPSHPRPASAQHRPDSLGTGFAEKVQRLWF